MIAFANNRPNPRAGDWDQYWERDQTQRFTRLSWSKRRIMKVLAPYARSGLKALDAGCGSGFFSRFFCEQGMSVTALDYSQEALDIARNLTKGRAALVQCDLLDPKVPEKIQDRYDLIFTDGLFEHFTVEQQDQIVLNFKALLNSGGHIVTFVPNRFSPWELIRPFYMPGIHEKPFTFSGLMRLNRRNGLNVIRSGGVNTWPFAFSPDQICGRAFGMLLYTIAQKS